MVAIIINILEEVAKKVIFDKLGLINSENTKSKDIPTTLFSKEEIAKLLPILNNSKISNSSNGNLLKFFSFIFDIHQAIIALMSPFNPHTHNKASYVEGAKSRLLPLVQRRRKA